MSKSTLPEIPIACSLSSEELTDREGAWRKLLQTSLVACERVHGGLRLTVHPGAASALNDLVDLERECCPWITFLVKGESVTMTAQGEGENVLVELVA